LGGGCFKHRLAPSLLGRILLLGRRLVVLLRGRGLGVDVVSEIGKHAGLVASLYLSHNSSPLAANLGLDLVLN